MGVEMRSAAVGAVGVESCLISFISSACRLPSIIQADVCGEGAVVSTLVQGHGAQVRRLPLARSALTFGPSGEVSRPLGTQPPCRESTLHQKVIQGLQKSALFGFSVCTLHMAWCCACVCIRAPTLWVAVCDTLPDATRELLSGVQSTLLCSLDSLLSGLLM